MSGPVHLHHATGRFFVPTLNLHFPKIKGVGIYTVKTVGFVGNNGLLELANYFLSANFDGKRIPVTVDHLY